MGVTYTEPREAIAIVGMACRFPGGAHSPEQFYRNLIAGKSAWCEFPSDRLNIGGFYHPSALRHESFHFKGAHFLTQNIAAFDSEFFSMSATESNSTDVQQRILLEVAYEAVENAGIPKEELAGINASVYIGSFVKDYEQVSMRDTQNLAADCATGNGIAIMSNRISYFFDIHGPSMTIDTGCSASLICIHQAVQSLLRGESSLAMAGGAGMILTPSTIMPMVSLGFLSPDGKCYAFDSRANGYGRGEGVGIVVLKRLSDAIRDNDTIRGVIRGTATNQDGRTSGITLPSSEAQVVNIRKAYRDAGLDFSSTMFVECHGTGTQAGDPRELRAISDSFCHERDAHRPVLVGSAKTNIGHLEGSAGVAGVIKAVMTIENGIIPRHLNFEAWNPNIDHQALKVDVALENKVWPVDGLRRISVNSFGFGGSNAHAIIDDAAHYLGEELQVAANHNTKVHLPGVATHDDNGVQNEHGQNPQLFVLSAYDQGGISRLVDAHQQYLLQQEPERNLMRHYAYTLFKRRSKLQYKSFVVARSREELTTELERVKSSTPSRSSATKGLHVALIFCGQGAQYAGMAQELMEFEPFRSSMEACGAYLRTLDPTGQLDLIGALHQTGDAEPAAVNMPELAQPATTAVEMALVDLLMACGIKATSVVGHSSGEVAAAYAAGLLSAKDALRIAYYRGQVVSQIPLKGKMLAVAASAADAQKYIDKLENKSVCVACTNSPVSVTLSGDADQILLVQALLDQDGVDNKLVAVETAYHSHHIQTVSRDYLTLLEREPLETLESNGPIMYSSVTGDHLHVESLGPAYWVDNMISPVEFERAVTKMVKETGALRPDAFLEVSPHSVFRLALRDIVAGAGEKEIPYFPMMVRKQDAAITSLNALGELWSRGLSFQLDWLHEGPRKGKPKCLVDLPTYPWNHSQTYWHESHLSKAHRFRKFGAHDFLGAPSPDSVSPQEPCWRGFIDTLEQPWIEHHEIQRQIMYPAAGMVIMAIEAAKQVVDDFVDPPSDILDFEVSKFQIHEPMVIPEGQTRLEYNFKATRVKESTVDRLTSWKYNFRIYTVLDSSAVQARHTLNARGYFMVRFKPNGLSEDKASITRHLSVWGLTKEQFEAARKETFQKGGMVPREFYERLNIIGLTYGRLFRNLTAMTDARPVEGNKSTRYCYAKVTIPNTRVCMPAEYETPSTMHPATLDAMFQSLFVLGDEPLVPHYIESIRILAETPQGAGSEFFGHAVACKNGTREAVSDINMWHGANPAPIVGVRGLRVISMMDPGKAIPDYLPHHRHLCSQVVWNESISSATDASLRGRLMPDFDHLLDRLGHKNPTLRVVQIGGASETVDLVLQRLASHITPRLGLYTICSKSLDIFDAALAGRDLSERKDLRPLLRHVELDDDGDVCGALGDEQFDLVLADQRLGLDHDALLRIVKPAGILAWTHEEHGLVDTDNTLTKHVAKGNKLDTDKPTPPYLPKRWIYRAQSDPSKLKDEKVVILIPEAPHSDSSNEDGVDAFSDAFFLESYGLTAKPKSLSATQTVQDSLATALSEALSREAYGLAVEIMTLPAFLRTGHHDSFVISLLEAGDRPLTYNINSSDYSLVHQLLQVNTKSLLWVTRGAQMDTPLPEQSPFLGWARTVRSEEPDKTIICVDIDPATGDVQDWVRLICNIFLRSFASTDDTAIKDTEFAVKDGRIYIPRLEPLKVINDIIDRVDSHQPCQLDGDAAYVVSGGLGGLGLDVLKWLADHGARHLTVLSRSGPSEHGRAVEALNGLRERGVDVVVDPVDICNEEACFQVIQEIQMERPVKGIVQAAAVVKDGIYQNLTHEDWKAVTRVKTIGSMNLHNATRAYCSSMAFFIFLSSAAGIIGNLGQANYNAGNVFQDALARHRRAQGLHSVSIDLGPVLGAGMVAEDEALWDILRAGGFVGVRLEDFHIVLDLAISGSSSSTFLCPPQVVMGVGTGGLVKQQRTTNPFWTRTALFSLLNRVDIHPGTNLDNSGKDSSRGGASALQPALQAATSKSEAVNLLLPYFIRALGEVMGKNVAEIDADSILDDHGPDSLRMKEILDWIHNATGIKIAGVNQMALRGICGKVVEDGGFGSGGGE